MTNLPLTSFPLPLIVLIGPTSSGKSELAVFLAKKFNGEIISVDSRQIYKGMDLGTGKVTGKWQTIKFDCHPERVHPREGSLKIANKKFIYKSIPHYCIDYVSPKSQYSVARFQRDAKKVIADILKRGKLPILCGGTAHWVDAVVFEQHIPEVKPNKKLRDSLAKKSTDQLYEQLLKLDPTRAATIDRNNPRRLIRALEIVITTGKPVPLLKTQSTDNVLWMGIKTNQDVLYKKIEKRLKQRLKQGMIKEVERLKKSGLSWKKLESFGLEYKFIAEYLQKKITYDEMFTQLLFAIKHYSKRQLTWWKRNKQIHWIQTPSEATKLIKTKM